MLYRTEMKKIFFPVAICAIVLHFLSCAKEECNRNISNDAGMGFYTFQDSIETMAGIKTLSLFGEARPDSLLYDSVQNATSVRLPLDPNKDFSHFVFRIASQQDTVKINYSRQLHFISQACGFIMDFHIQDIGTTHHLFDSVVMTEPNVTLNSDEEHIKIYLPPPDTTGQ